MNTLARALAILGGLKRNWRRPEALLLLMGLVMPIAFSTWLALLNNFAIERAAFTGVEIGILQSLREVPGFLAFTVVFALLLVREQTLGLLSLCLLGLGVAITGYFPTVVGLYLTTVAMSIGFHYHEAIRQSLALQWLDKDKAPAFFGNMIAVGAFASLITYGAIYLGLDLAGMDMTWIYAIGGGLALALAIFGWVVFPRFPQKVEQRKHLVLRRRYWLYYALIFMQGARRQIFVVFAGFLMVEKFGFDAAAISLMFLFNTGVNIFLAPFVGHLIARWGERRALTVEYVGLIAVFSAYAFVELAWIGVALYILDHAFFAINIAIRTYFQKIADPADIASTTGVSFTINHIAAVVLPVAYGFVWLVSPAAVFLTGAALAVLSLVLSRLIPDDPRPGNESLIFRPPPLISPAT